MAGTERADVVVVGGGLLGLATAYALRERRDVLVLEREVVGHRRGGSHGPSRVFRLGYSDPFYVGMALRSLPRWRALERDAGTRLLEVTGQCTFGAGAADVFAALTSAGAPVEQLDAAQVDERFPMFAGHGGTVFEPESGVLAADAVLRALAATARCELRDHTRVLRVVDGTPVRVETDHGRIDAGVVVVTAGPWTRQLLGGVPTFATLEHVAYVRPRPDAPRPPVFIADGEPVVYGLPTPGSDLYKVALHHAGAVVDPDRTDLAPDARAIELLAAATRTWLPDFDPEAEEVDTCLYDNTSDQDFVLDRSGNVVVGAGTSGHGFKFGLVIGELLADLVEDVRPSVAIKRFRRGRGARHEIDTRRP